MLTKMKTAAVAVGLAIGALALPASAATITGTFSMAGDFTPMGGSGTLATATGIDFTGNLRVAGPITGNFVGLLVADNTGTINDFTFAPSAAVNDLYTINGFTFDLDSVSVVAQGSTFLLLSGTGVISGNGFDATTASWNFSANTVGNVTFSWSASSGAAGLPGGGGANVPEPATLALLGAGLAFLGVTRRKR